MSLIIMGLLVILIKGRDRLRAVNKELVSARLSIARLILKVEASVTSDSAKPMVKPPVKKRKYKPRKQAKKD